MTQVFTNIKVSPSSKLHHRGLLLSNQIKVLLISDPNSQKSAASMNVGIGNYLDPKDFQGLAHFLEHMLFQGSKKYPGASYFMGEVPKYGGSTNAFTATQDTNYHFDCNSDGFFQLLEIWSQFFTEPLLLEESSQKEMNAVNAEANNYLNQDVWKNLQLMAHLSEEDSLCNTYNVGNQETLNKPGVHKALREFYDKYYSSDIMCLAIQHNDTLDIMQQKVEELFANVANKNNFPLSYKGFTFPYKKNQGKVVKAVPVKNEDIMNINFICESWVEDQKSKPLNYLSHLLGHESTGSIIMFLKAEGLADSLGSCPDLLGDYFGSMKIQIKLTKKGLGNWERVLSIVFGYINMLNKEGAQEWFFNESKNLLDINWNFQSKSKPLSLVTSMSKSIATYGIEDSIKGPFISDPYKPDLINSICKKLTPENALIFITSPEYKEKTDLIEPVYKTTYCVEGLTEKQINNFKINDFSWTESGLNLKNLHQPGHNPFIPENFEVYYTGERIMNDKPECLRNDNKCTFHFMQDTQFQLPKFDMNCIIYCDSYNLYNNMETYFLAKLWNLELEDYQKHYKYHAEQASFEFDVMMHNKGIMISSTGYNDSFKRFLTWFLEELERFKTHFNEKRLTDMINDEKTTIKNLLTMEPYRQALDTAEDMIQSNRIGVYDLLESIDSLTLEKYKAFKPNWLKNIRFEVLLEGNLTRQMGIEYINTLVDSFEKIFEPMWMSIEDIKQIRPVKLNDNSHYIVEKELSNENEKNCCYLSSYVIDHDIEKFPLLEWLDAFLGQEYFEDLRTNQQLGYLVTTYPQKKSDLLLFGFLIQSSVKEPNYIHEKTQDFIHIKAKKMIDEVSKETFDKLLDAIIIEYKEDSRNIYEESAAHWKMISRLEYDFDYTDKMVEICKKMTMDDVKKCFYRTFIENPRVIELHYLNQGMKEESRDKRKERVEKKKVIEVKNPNVFKNMMELYPDNWSLKKD